MGAKSSMWKEKVNLVIVLSKSIQVKNKSKKKKNKKIKKIKKNKKEN